MAVDQQSETAAAVKPNGSNPFGNARPSTSTHRSQVGTSTPQVSTLFPRRDAFGEIKDEAEDKFDEDTWFTADEKRNKMTKESIIELLEEIPLPPPFSTQVPALQEPANYGTDLETSVYEGQIRSGYRVPMHPFAVAFFNHYKMVPGQLVPNGWRKLVGLIYLVQNFRKWLANEVVQKASKGKRKEGTGEGSSPLVKRARAPTRPMSPLVVEDLPINKDPIFCPRWTIKRGDSGMPSSHAYCYSSQMQDRFAMAMDEARTAETDKRAAEGKADKLDKEVKNLEAENADLLTKLGHLEKRCEKLRHEKTEIGNKAIQAFLDGTAGEERLQKRIEDGLSIFQEGFQKAKELTMAKYPCLFLDNIVVPTFESPSRETAAPPEAGDAISPGKKNYELDNAIMIITLTFSVTLGIKTPWRIYGVGNLENALSMNKLCWKLFPSDLRYTMKHQNQMDQGKEEQEAAITKWDCGSPLYDTYELVSLSYHIDRHLMAWPYLGGSRRITPQNSDASSTLILSMPLPSDGRALRKIRGCSLVAFLSGFVERNAWKKRKNKVNEPRMEKAKKITIIDAMIRRTNEF
ncbi:hypothetical protein RJ639_025859 [Escallonia herrerae]|uniref:Transposase (putative) gypsy type domain-containing protein n=1 Tax=Escallonia herrerae TaxID=1293975 RepID=A0AA88UWA0_9ASTE|nr:hypothetical protein RJ639_025859 [Escallonia herrerae]